MTKVVSLRLPEGTITRLKLFDCQQSLKQGREVRWTTMIRDIIEKTLVEQYAIKDDEVKFMAAARESAQQLEALFEADAAKTD